MTTTAGNIPQLIAHRGYSGRYPENTLLAYQAAYAYGNRWMECDVQLTADQQPMVHHDETITRMSGVNLDIRQLTSEQLQQYSAHYPERFGDEFLGNAFTPLSELVSWMSLDRDIRLFVEIKQESIDVFGAHTCLDHVCQCVQMVRDQCVIISFNRSILDYARRVTDLPIGWVIPSWDSAVESAARQLKPEFLFSDKNLLPGDSRLWWQDVGVWAIYNVDQPQEALDWAARGIEIIETNEIGALLRHPDFAHARTT